MKRPIKKAAPKRRGYAEGGQVGDGRFVRVDKSDLKPGEAFQKYGQDYYRDTKAKPSYPSAGPPLGPPPSEFYGSADTSPRGGSYVRGPDLGPDLSKAKGGKVRKVIRKRR